MTTQHTPGPWLVMDNTVYALETDERGRQVNRFWATVSGTRFTPDGEELEANARLIAAAPDLLAAVEYLFPRAHQHLADQGKLKEISAIVAKVRGLAT